MLSSIAKKQIRHTGCYVACILLLCQTSCFLDAFAPRFQSSLGRTVYSHSTTPAFSIHLHAKRRQNPEYEVVDEGEADDSVTGVSMEFDDDEGFDDDMVESFEDIDEDDEELLDETEIDEEEEDEEYYEDEEIAVASTIRNDNTASGNKDEESVRFQGTKCLGALFKPAVASSSAGAAVVSIQVGDVNLARKAWKKRRRSGSPILVPCSVLSVDPKTLVRSNFMYLLYKYGVESKGTAQQRPGLELSMSEVAHFHRKQFNTSLVKLSNAMGFDSPQEMVENVMDDTFQQRQGMYLLPSPSGESNNMMLWTPLLSRRRAHQRVNEHAVVLEFALDNDDGDIDEPSTTLGLPKVRHTGRVQDSAPRQVAVSAAEVTSDATIATPSSSSSLSKKKRTMAPLSAALRVSSQASLSNLPSGSIHSAVVFGFDSHGDGGFPLLTLSLVLPDAPESSSGSQRVSSDKQPREQQKLPPQLNWVDFKPCEYALNELHVGQGPLDATVVHVSKAGTVYVDAMVGRHASSSPSSRRGQKQKQQDDDSLVPVVGMLRRQDALHLNFRSQGQQRGRISTVNEDEDMDDIIEAALGENDEDFDDDDDDEDDDDEEEDEKDLSFLFRSIEDASEIDEIAAQLDKDTSEEDGVETTEEDVTHLFELQEDGSLLYRNPETGESEVFQLEMEAEDDDEDEDEEFEDEDDDDDEDSQVTSEILEFVSSSMASNKSGQREPSDSKALLQTSSKVPLKPGYKRRQLKVGDKVQVYVKAVSKQSGRFMVTMDPEVRKPKEVKREHAVEKKLARLAQQLGGSLDRISEFRGQECSGIVKATSQTSDWLYVQPQLDNLPVGVATLSSVLRQSEEDGEVMIQAGDAVRIRLDGIDEERGQLAMTVLEKLAP